MCIRDRRERETHSWYCTLCVSLCIIIICRSYIPTIASAWERSSVMTAPAALNSFIEYALLVDGWINTWRSPAEETSITYKQQQSTCTDTVEQISVVFEFLCCVDYYGSITNHYSSHGNFSHIVAFRNEKGSVWAEALTFNVFVKVHAIWNIRMQLKSAVPHFRMHAGVQCVYVCLVAHIDCTCTCVVP